MSESVDVVVVGAGLAGFCAALAAREGGASVVIVERSADETHLCNTRYTGGLFHIAMEDMAGEPSWVRDNLVRATAGENSLELADALSANARRTLRWLAGHGVQFIQAGPDGLRRNALSPPGVRQTGLNWRGRSGDVMLRTLERRLVAAGGLVRRGSEARELIINSGRCVGLTLAGGKQIPARAVVIADGGFQANLDLLRHFITPAPERLLQRNALSGCGAGLLMAEAAGAMLIGTDRFYGHVQHRDAMTNQALWPYPVLDSLATAGILVDGASRRFCDEGQGGVAATNAISRLDDPLSATIVFDDAIWKGPGRDWLLPANPYLPQAGGKIVTADSLEELASRLGLDPSALAHTAASYNALIEGAPADGQPSRRSDLYRPWPIREAPFHAVPVCAGITYTMGGIATNARGRVIDASGDVIPGLYAVGACTGGLEGGGPRAGYSGGLSKSAVFGLLAGEDIASVLRSGEVAA